MKSTRKNSNSIFIILLSTLLFIAVLFVCFFLPLTAEGATESSIEDQIAEFPESYQPMLWEIHDAYPNYSFQADYLNTTFDEAVYQQSLYHRKLVSMSYDSVSWRSLSPSCYNASTGTWSTFSGNWTDAAINVIEFYMDPRNFLSVNNMYMFVQQTYTGKESRSGVESIAGSSFLSGNYKDSTGTHNYIDTIMEAAKETGVSPYVIAATIRVEQPYSGKSPLIDGSHDGYYNFFNFGAAGSDVVGNGISFAKSQGWDTVYKSIAGGARIYYNDYLKYEQDTYFYKDFNLVNGDYDHQYAQGVYDPLGSAVFLKNALGGDHNASAVLRIPVYQAMYDVPPSYPPENDQLNPRYLVGATETGWVCRDGKWYYIEKNGVLKHGWLKDDGKWYYLDDSGVMQTGWVTIGGDKFYMDASGAMQTGWFFDKGWYYLTDSGKAKFGWLTDGKIWYYMGTDGIMQTGWIKVNGNRYYMDPEGVMQTGWLVIDEDRYYLEETGELHTEWLYLDKNWYYMGADGIMQTGWQQIDDNWYFLYPSGIMAQNEWYAGYWLGADGTWTYQAIGSWSEDEKGWWFGDTQGWYAKDEKCKINGTLYSFDASGYLQE